jgi:ABC-2 type transport system permease protein
MNLLRTELRKIFPYRTFWIIVAIYLLLLLLIVYASSSIVINGSPLGPNTYKFPEIWNRLTYIASFFNLLLGILVIVLVTDEFSFKTIRQQIIDGLSRFEFIKAKFFLILAIAICSTIFLMITGLYFGLTHSLVISAQAIFSQIDHLFYFFLQAVAYMTLAMLFAFIVRKSGLAIIGFIAYTKVVEPLIHYSIDDTLDQYFPMKVLSSLIPLPGQEILDQFTSSTTMLSQQWAAPLAILYIVLFLIVSYAVIKLRDL